MFKLRATILKDLKILFRDKIGLIFMFVMPIILTVVITSLQVSTFDLVNENKVHLVISNRDNGESSKQFIKSVEKMGMFQVTFASGDLDEKHMTDLMHQKDALVAISIPSDFSEKITMKAKSVTDQAINNPGVQEKAIKERNNSIDPITMFYHPVLQDSYRQSILGALRSCLQLVEIKQIIQTLYFSMNEKVIPDNLEDEIVNNQAAINEIPVSKDGSRTIPNATQHNIPAWTIFAMFFIVTSLGSSVVKEKQSGSFVRLKTLPTNYLVALLSKQITYIFVCLAQVAVIFSLGVWLFPVIGLPQLNIPHDLFGLFIVSLICGWCAVSYALTIGIFAQTQEQANGFGAVSIVILAAIGGILVPSFAMPSSFQFIMKLSPLHWCLESYYGLFLEGGNIKDVFITLMPLVGITLFLQLISFIALKNKNLI